jgi:hypothetical protein
MRCSYDGRWPASNVIRVPASSGRKHRDNLTSILVVPLRIEFTSISEDTRFFGRNHAFGHVWYPPSALSPLPTYTFPPYLAKHETQTEHRVQTFKMPGTLEAEKHPGNITSLAGCTEISNYRLSILGTPRTQPSAFARFSVLPRPCAPETTCQLTQKRVIC